MAHGIVVRVLNTVDQSVADHTFRRLPVRIGRNPLNDLVLENPVVSQFHAVLELHGQGLFLRDLGSTNGTTLRAIGRVPPNQIVNLAEHQYEFAIVSLLLRVWAVTLPDQPVQATSARRPLGVTSMFALAPQGTPAAGPANQHVGAVMMRLAGPYSAYRTAWKQFLQALQTGLNELPQAARPALLQQIAKDYPEAGLEPEFRTLAAQHGATSLGGNTLSADSVAFQGLRELAQDFVPDVPAPSGPHEAAAFAARIQATLDVFIRSFLPLRDGYRQFEYEMAIRTSAPPHATQMGRASVRAARDAKELARLLLDWREKSHDSFAEVEATFADLMIHQVAMLNGVMRGVRTLLAELAPTQVERALKEGRVRASGMQGKYRALWRAYEERYGDVAEDEKQIYSLLFGAQFARAYEEGRVVADDKTSQLPSAQWPRRGGT